MTPQTIDRRPPIEISDESAIFGLKSSTRQKFRSGGGPSLCLSDTGNKIQKCSETRFQGRSTVLEGVTSSKSDNGAHFTHFRGKVSFSKSVTFWRWERLSRSTGNPPENILESWIFFQQHFIPNVAEKDFVFCCRLLPP